MTLESYWDTQEREVQESMRRDRIRQRRHSVKFDHDNEGKEALSPHAAMARMAVEKARKEAQRLELDEALYGFSVYDVDEGKRVDPRDVSTKDDATD